MTFQQASRLVVCVAASLLSQACVQYVPGPDGYPPPPPPPPPPPYAPQPAVAPTLQAQPPPPQASAPNVLDPLLAPIALYPDPLIALILPASTAPQDITAAAAYLVQYGDPARIDSQPWDPSVRALTHYPTVVTWMANNIAWTQALGSAFSTAPAEVMDEVQSLRARAVAAGTLVSTPQQQVFDDSGAIEILPTQPDDIYVPVYDPGVVYSDEPYYGYGGPFINFGSPYPSGVWLSYCFDWHRHRVWEGARDTWHEHVGWNPPHMRDDRPPAGAAPWQPRPGAVRTRQQPQSPRSSPPPAPRPMPGAPNPPPDHYKRPDAQPNSSAKSSAQVPLPSRSAPPLERPRIGTPSAQGSSGATPRPLPSNPPESERRPPDSQPRQVQQQAPQWAPATEAARTAPQPQAAPVRGPEHPAARVQPAAHAAPAQAAPAQAQAAPASSTGDNKQPQR